MKGFSTIFILLIALLAVFNSTTGCGDGKGLTSEPEQVVRAYLAAYEAMDVQGVAEQLTAEVRDKLLEEGEHLFDDFDEIEFSNIETTLVAELERGATVRVEYDLLIIQSGYSSSGHTQELIYLVKEGDIWLIRLLPGDIPRDDNSLHNFEIDEVVMQLAASSFYADVHAGWMDIKGDDNPSEAATFNDNVWGRVGDDTEMGHYLPTAIALADNHILEQSSTTLDRATDNPQLVGINGPATTAEITAHAIWMGLLVNDDGQGTQYDGTKDRDRVSPLDGEYSQYLNYILESSMAGDDYNGAREPGGSYCWVVGKNGIVYGAYKGNDGYWYAGYNGIYP
jgi:hypothetical protein